MEERLIKKLMASIKCSTCGQRYKTDNVDVLDHNDEVWFLSISCYACRTQCLVAAIIKEDKLTETAGEAAMDGSGAAEAVSINDVADMHNFLREFDGDFSHLFAVG